LAIIECAAPFAYFTVIARARVVSFFTSTFLDAPTCLIVGAVEAHRRSKRRVRRRDIGDH
jgi:hypothetical protein